MIFLDAIWLILLFPVMVIFLLYKAPSRIITILRLISVLLVICALANLAIKLPSKIGSIVVVADRSLSMPEFANKKIEETINLLVKDKPSDNNYAVISYAEKTIVEKTLDNSSFTGLKGVLNGNQSRLNDGLKSALAMIPENSSGRILLLTDGRWTGDDPSSSFADCINRQIAVDYRIIGRSKLQDLFISNIEAPQNVQTKEFYTVKVNINSPKEQKIKYKLFKNKLSLLAGELQLKKGENSFYFKDISARPKIMKYNFIIEKILKEKDAFPENNHAQFIVKATGRRPVLLLTMSKKSGYGKLLKRSGFNIDIKLPREVDFSLSQLANYSGIIIENVPASKIGNNAMEIIKQLVKNSGLGLVFTGGQNSYAVGGYYDSPLEDIMPVSMELKQEHRKLNMAIVVVLDRSGSMGMPSAVDSSTTKMDMANISSVEVLKLLSPIDKLGVIAVDSQPHTILNLMSVEEALSRKWKILDIQSMGGGIYVYNGLVAAVDMLTKTKASTRHIILFADAADAEQPGSYKSLLEQTTAAGITVSVIGLGSERDSDAEFLKDVAKRGQGRCFFADKAQELPRLFAQDTFVVARNTFIKESTKIKFNGELATLGKFKFLTAANKAKKLVIDGYNLNYLRPNAYCGALTVDEYKSPIVAFWQSNLGRVICYSGEVDGEFAKSFSKWEYTGNLLNAMVEWAIGLNSGNSGLPNDMLITQELKNGVNVIRLHLDPNRKIDPFKKLPVVTTIKSLNGAIANSSMANMSWENADTLILKIPLIGREVSLSTIKIANINPYLTAPVMLPYSPEFKMSNVPNSESNVENMAKMTGGVERVSLNTLWDDLPKKLRIQSIRPWLLSLAIIIFLLEILERRTGVLFKKRQGLANKKEKKVQHKPLKVAKVSIAKKSKINSNITKETTEIITKGEVKNNTDKDNINHNEDDNKLFDAFAEVKKKHK